MNIVLKRIPVVYRWLLLSLVPLALFLIYTLLVTNGSFASLTVHQEQWLLQRPLTRFDCVVAEWDYVGEAQASLVILLVICAVCWLLKYRLRVAFVLLLLLGVGVGVEYLGKQYITQPVPNAVQDSMDALFCPQMWRIPRLQRVSLVLGMWWIAPPTPQFRVAEARAVAAGVYNADENAPPYVGYPSGHAYRWMLIGLVACWLVWRHVRKRLLRWLLMFLFLALALLGGFGLFYVGRHLFTDLIGGYLLGAFLACCAIAALCAGEARNRWQLRYLAALPIAENNDTLLPKMRS